MAKYTATIDEGTRQRIHALPRAVHFSAFMRKAIKIFVEELERDPDLEPDDFVIARAERRNAPNTQRT